MSDSGQKKPGLLGYNHACQTDSTSFRNQQQQQQVTSATTMNTCNVCHKQFSTPATLRRHTDALHAQQRTKFQCWSCDKIYARKENVLWHARKHTETQTENSSLLHWQTHIISQKYSNQRHGHHRWKQDPETSSDSTSLHLKHLQALIHREKTYPQTQTINYPNGLHLLPHSYSSYTRPAAMNFY